MTATRLFPLSGSQHRHPSVEGWLAAQSGALGAQARAWFQVLRDVGPNVTELLHDGHATVCVEGQAFAYVAVFRQHLNVGFFLGATLPDPDGVLEGTGTFMRHVKVRADTDAHWPALRALIAASYRDMASRVPAAPRPAGATPV